MVWPEMFKGPPKSIDSSSKRKAPEVKEGTKKGTEEGVDIPDSSFPIEPIFPGAVQFSPRTTFCHGHCRGIPQ